MQQVFYIATFIVGIPANLLVILIVAARRDRRTANDIFILNLAISDLMYLFFCLPTNMYMMFADIQYNLYCRLIWPLMTVAVNLSIFTLTSMAIFRCHAILNPFKPEMKHRYILVWILGIWLLGLTLVIPLLLVTSPQLAEPQGCFEDWPSMRYRQAYTAGLFVMQFIFPLTIIAVAYMRIGLDLVHRVPDHFVNEARTKENVQIIKTLAAIVTLFAVCMLPAQLAWMLYDFGTQDQHKKVADSFFSFSPALLYFHSCLNPIAYGTLTKHFRQGYIRFFSCIFCCGLTSFVKKEAASKKLSCKRSTWCSKQQNVESTAFQQQQSSTNSSILTQQEKKATSTTQQRIQNNFEDVFSLHSNESAKAPLWKESVV